MGLGGARILMLRQYWPSRFRLERIGGRRVPVGTIPVGTRFGGGEHCPPCIVEAWLPRKVGAGALGPEGWEPRYMARGGHLAIIRRLDTGRRFRLSDWIVRTLVDDPEAGDALGPVVQRARPIL